MKALHFVASLLFSAALLFGAGAALAQDAPPTPRTRDSAAPEAFVTIYVDRSDDANVTTCTAATNDCTLRGAINKANGDAANIYLRADYASMAIKC